MRHFPNHVALGVSNRLIQERSHILEYTALHSGLRRGVKRTWEFFNGFSPKMASPRKWLLPSKWLLPRMASPQKMASPQNGFSPENGFSTKMTSPRKWLLPENGFSPKRASPQKWLLPKNDFSPKDGVSTENGFLQNNLAFLLDLVFTCCVVFTTFLYDM